MGRTKFIVGGVLILAAVVYLIFSATKANAEYFMTVDELKAKEYQHGRPGCARLGRSRRRYDSV